MAVLRKRGLPYVTVDSDPLQDVPAVNIDDEGGARQAMLHLLDKGHRQITILAILSPKHGHYQEYTGTLGARMRGYLAALESHAFKINGRSIRLLECVNTEAGGGEGFQTLWKSRRPPTGVVAMSDIIALGFLKAAQANGVRVPEDLSIVGFDDIPLSSLVEPQLTTISQPTREKGRLAASILFKMIEGAKPVEHHVLPTELVQRGTVAGPCQ
jgi:DNA-binding LacI/PurR family transcriptional regulator